MASRTGGTLAALAAIALLAGTAVHAHAGELGFLEMLFGARPAPQPFQPAPYASRAPARIGVSRHRLRIRYAALPVRVRAGRDISERQTPIDMKAGAAAALLKDETLRPGDIVVLKTGARVFTGDPDERHAIRDFEPVHGSPYVSAGTRRQLANLFAPAGAMPADEARHVVARMRKGASAANSEAVAAPAPEKVVTQATAMRVINPWQGGQ